MTEKPPLYHTEALHANTEALSANTQALNLPITTLKLPSLDAGIFYQIRAPSITDNHELDSRLARAEAGAIGYVVSPRQGANFIWLVISENAGLWRWALTEEAFFDAACEDYEWLRDVPQLFLVGQPPVEHEGYPAYRSRTPKGDEE